MPTLSGRINKQSAHSTGGLRVCLPNLCTQIPNEQQYLPIYTRQRVRNFHPILVGVGAPRLPRFFREIRGSGRISPRAALASEEDDGAQEPGLQCYVALKGFIRCQRGVIR